MMSTVLSQSESASVMIHVSWTCGSPGKAKDLAYFQAGEPWGCAPTETFDTMHSFSIVFAG